MTWQGNTNSIQDYSKRYFLTSWWFSTRFINADSGLMTIVANGVRMWETFDHARNALVLLAKPNIVK